MIGALLAEGYAKLEEKGIDYRRGAETGSALDINRRYLDSLTIEMRVIDAAEASTEMRLFGHTFATPVMVGALSSLRGLCADPMVEVAKAALAANAVMFVGVGEEPELRAVIETGVQAVKIVKPYKDRDLIYKKIEQTERAGAFAVGMDIIFAFGGKIKDRLVRADTMAPQSLAEIRSYVQATGLPFVLKGILSVRDAEKALEAGAAAIVVSHHGGSTLDYAVPPLKVLPGIVKAVDGRIPIIVDSGIVRGTDVFKALALGAAGVLIGRTVMAGLAAEGRDGAEKIITGTNEELRRVMRLTGSPDTSSIDPGVLWQI